MPTRGSRKRQLSVVERYINKLMRTGKYTGKKQGAMKAFEEASTPCTSVLATTRCNSSLTRCATRLPWRRSPASSSVPCRSRRPSMPPVPPPDIALRNLAAGAASVRASSSARSPSALSTKSRRRARRRDLLSLWRRRKKLSASRPRPGERSALLLRACALADG